MIYPVDSAIQRLNNRGQVYCGLNSDLYEFWNPTVTSLGHYPSLPPENGYTRFQLIQLSGLQEHLVSHKKRVGENKKKKLLACSWSPSFGMGVTSAVYVIYNDLQLIYAIFTC